TLSEYENNLLVKNTSNKSGYTGQNKSVFNSSDEYLMQPVSNKIGEDLKTLNHELLLNQSASGQIKVKLLAQLSQELRTPLTSVMGMASVLNREVYGPLTNKQKEYLEIIYNSGQQLVSIVDEILGLGVLDEEVNNQLNLTSQDMEMLCQQVINSVEKTRLIKQQDIRLSGGNQHRIWVIDKEKVRQMIYYLLLSIMQTADISTTIHIRIYRKNRKLHIAFWVSHPLLGEGLPSEQISSKLPLPVLINVGENVINSNVNNYHFNGDLGKGEKTKSHNNSRENLGLLLSCQLAQIHQGQIIVESSSEINCRYVIILPQLDGQDNEN
ncbi:MAG TPA: HAMP domain-containing sensor histidine kinase, partial [Allocoleopsis sp.]